MPRGAGDDRLLAKDAGEVLNMCKSMPRRLRRVIDAKGGPIKY